jgi:nitrite reductase (NO-forming)
MHVMQGMYLPIIVDPRSVGDTRADKEFVLVQSEFYAKASDTTVASTAAMQPDWQAALAKSPSQVVFNGRAFQYKDSPLKVAVGDRVTVLRHQCRPVVQQRLPHCWRNIRSSVPGRDRSHALYERPDLHGAGRRRRSLRDGFSAANESGEGLYPFVTHSFADAEKGSRRNHSWSARQSISRP